MAGSTSIFRVLYHFENAGKKASPDYIDYLSAADSSYNSLRTVLSNNSKLLGPGTLVIDSAHNIGTATLT